MQTHAREAEGMDPLDELDLYGMAVFDSVAKDQRFQRMITRVRNPETLHVVFLCLVGATLDGHDQGMSPESTSEMFLVEFKRAWDNAEREALLKMPVQGTH